jgi:glycosyltransferase involved in cell wall biosynthesis
MEAIEATVTPSGTLEEDGGGLDRVGLFHAFHAWKTGRIARKLSRDLGVPYVVSLTGTDIQEDLERPDRRDAVIAVLAGAAALLVPNEEAEKVIRERGVMTPLVRVTKGIEPPGKSGGRGEEQPANIVFFFPGGWRAVKNNIFPLEPLARLAAEVPRMRLRFAGPVLEAPYHALWEEQRGRFSFAEDAGVIGPDGMAREYAASAVVLNASHSEGGSNAILEAMAARRPVLASDVPGNRALIDFRPGDWDGSTGVLYRTKRLIAGGPARSAHDAGDFYEKARRLALDPALRARIGRNAREQVLAEHSPEREMEGVLEAYRIAELRGIPDLL